MSDKKTETLAFQAEVKQLLDIVIHSLYSNKEIFLRELISNASDAIDKRRFEALSQPALHSSEESRIRLTVDKEAKTLTISDNGIGMTHDEIISHLGTIAKSGTKEFFNQLTGDAKKDSHLIGQFGVGFYSAFIVADHVRVESRRAGSQEEDAVGWESAGDGEYQISSIRKDSCGTDVILHMREGQEDFLDNWRLQNIVTKYSDYLGLPIELWTEEENEDKQKISTWKKINRGVALWSLPKSSIKPEDFNELYRHISHDFSDPLEYALNKIEGNLEYTSVLFIPEHAPFDFWHRDKQHGLKLYVQRVFIMDQVDQFLPFYLRFVRGILDTTALPLNISREILQDHPSIQKIRAALSRHVLDLLERMIQEKPEKYAKFWKEFGSVLKEGPAEDFSNRERIAKLFRFSTTKENLPEPTVTLDEYVARMPEKQTKIYYLVAEHFNAAKSSPHLEVFRKHNIEVLLLPDRIDDWMTGHLAEFAGKTLQSVTKGDINLAEITGIEEVADEQKEEQKDSTLDPALLEQIKTILTDDIKEVRVSKRLTDSPACLVRDENALSAQMERMLKAAGQSVPETKPILEINPQHRLVQHLQSVFSSSEQFQQWTHLLYEQAVLMEGGALKDPAQFVQRMNRLWLEAF